MDTSADHEEEDKEVYDSVHMQCVLWCVCVRACACVCGVCV